jgi:cytochrome c oxidase cbb3-type subunit 1
MEKGLLSSLVSPKVRLQEFLREDPELTRVIYEYIGWSAFWLIVGTGAGFVDAIKFRYPDFLSTPWFSFGRLRPVHTNTMFWGFVSLAMVGLGLYVVPRTSQTRLHSYGLARVALWLWNFTVAAGIVTLCLGISNGSQEYREYIWPLAIIFALGLLIHIYNFYLTIAERRTEEIYISNWYILAACLWLAVLYIISYLPWYQKGLAEVVIQGYYTHTAVGMWFTPFVVGLTYYFLPKFLNRPIYSYALGVLGFWTQLLFYSVIGAHHYIFSPIAWWLQTTAIVFSVAMMVPVWAGTGNFLLTMRGKWAVIRRSYSLPFILVGVIGYGLVSTQGTLMAFRTTNLYWHFTNNTVGHSHATMYGFVTFLLWGGIYGLLPRLTRREPNLTAVGLHFWFSLIGIIIYVSALVVGGTLQGMSWVSGQPFINSVIQIEPFWLWRTVGGLLMVVAHLIFAYNVWSMRPLARVKPSPVRTSVAEGRV